MGWFDWMRTGGQGLNLDPSQFQSPSLEAAQTQQVPWDLSSLQGPQAPQTQMYAPGLLGMAQQGMSNFHNNMIDQQSAANGGKPPTFASQLAGIGKGLGSVGADPSTGAQDRAPKVPAPAMMPRYQSQMPQYDPVARMFSQVRF